MGFSLLIAWYRSHASQMVKAEIPRQYPVVPTITTLDNRPSLPSLRSLVGETAPLSNPLCHNYVCSLPFGSGEGEEETEEEIVPYFSP